MPEAYFRGRPKMKKTIHIAVLSLLLIAAPTTHGEAETVTVEEMRKIIAAYDRGDYETYIMMLRPKAEEGNRGAQHYIALMYQHGKGVVEDNTEAARWYRLSAEQGFAEAQVNLGHMYSKGKGVTRDLIEAVRLYRQAAEQGNQTGQFNLGLAYDDGKGVIEDPVEAYAWISIAGAQGVRDAMNAKWVIKDEMNESTRERARERAREYWKKYVLPFRNR